MAAYAALVSLLNTVDQIPFFIGKNQVESLTEKVTFLQDFLEGYCHVGYRKEADALEMRIADAAYAAEDIIESRISNLIRVEPNSTSFHLYSANEIIDSINFERQNTPGHVGTIIGLFDSNEDLKKVIEDMDLIKKEVMQTRERMGDQDLLHRNTTTTGSLRSSSTWHNTMVGVDDILHEIMDRLTGHQSSRQVIPIVGMSGIGKTTLARNIYENQSVVRHFDIVDWVTISQEYKMRDIFLKLLHEDGTNLSQTDESELGNKLHKRLTRRRYLIIIDDIWGIEAWDQLQLFFPDDNKGSRIIITSRLSNLGFQSSGCHCFQMNFLDKGDSWKLLCQIVFGNEGCPLELEKIGKRIAKNCRGLPLSIVVIGGLLTKSKRQEYWKYTLENLNSIVNLEDNKRCSQVLFLSYNSLPVYLKPCFLYMGVFAEDSEICASELIKLWVAEGFLKPIDGKSLEEVAEGYLKELVDRNLILVHKLNFSGKIKLCKIHDLLRDLSLREAEKQKFMCVRGVQNLKPRDIYSQRRICISQHRSKKEDRLQMCYGLKRPIFTRSLIWERHMEHKYLPPFEMLKVSSMVNHFKGDDEHCLRDIFQQVNLRYLSIKGGLQPSFKFPSSVSRLWNLQTLIVRCFSTKPVNAPVEIWKMPQLRHVKFWRLLVLPNPPTDNIVLKNLQALSEVYNFKCGTEVVKRIPNIKKLGIHYAATGKQSPDYSLNNLSHLNELESLDCFGDSEDMLSQTMQNLTFPQSLKKLALKGIHLCTGLMTKIGSLSILEVLKLRDCSFMQPEWETIEGQFCKLKFLLICSCNDLECWTTDSTHFPRLQHLVLRNLKRLKEVPSSIGDIPTLQSIQLDCCSDSVVDSAKRIQEEQEELGNEGLHVFYGI